MSETISTHNNIKGIGYEYKIHDQKEPITTHRLIKGIDKQQTNDDIKNEEIKKLKAENEYLKKLLKEKENAIQECSQRTRKRSKKVR